MEHEEPSPGSAAATAAKWRGTLREQALTTALRKRAEGVPTYSVSEAAALLSISQEYLYRLIQGGSFPAVRMRLGASHGRYVVPARAVEQLLDAAADDGVCIDTGAVAPSWTDAPPEGAR